VTAERWILRGVEIEPCDELELLDQLPPAREDPAAVWLAWHERHIVCWERIAVEHAHLAANSAYLTRCHGRKILELHADPGSRTARRGYWDLVPKLTDCPNRT
jgi:hypothetical protein